MRRVPAGDFFIRSSERQRLHPLSQLCIKAAHMGRRPAGRWFSSRLTDKRVRPSFFLPAAPGHPGDGVRRGLCPAHWSRRSEGTRAGRKNTPARRGPRGPWGVMKAVWAAERTLACRQKASRSSPASSGDDMELPLPGCRSVKLGTSRSTLTICPPPVLVKEGVHPFHGFGHAIHHGHIKGQPPFPAPGPAGASRPPGRSNAIKGMGTSRQKSHRPPAGARYLCVDDLHTAPPCCVLDTV